MFNEGTCIQQDSFSSSERGSYETSKQKKQLSCICTSPDFQMGVTSDASTAKSPFSAVGRKQSPFPIFCINPFNQKSPWNFFTDDSKHPLLLSPTTELMEEISESVMEKTIYSESTHLNIGHRSMGHSTDECKGIDKRAREF